jgi:hypothetical protein
MKGERETVVFAEPSSVGGHRYSNYYSNLTETIFDTPASCIVTP